MGPDPHILLLDTSGKIGVVGLAGGEGVVAATELPGQLRHAAELLPALDALLAGQAWAADTITDIFLTIGPGSFTGLRLAVSVARTLAWSTGARIVSVGTMPVLARNALSLPCPPAHVVTLIDAKRGQAFAAAFELRDGEYEPIIDACVQEPAAFLSRCPRPLSALGEGLAVHGHSVAESGVDILPPERWPARAENIFALAIDAARQDRYTPAGELVPAYVRRPEMEERWEQRQKNADAK